MTDQASTRRKSFRPINHNTLAWKMFLVYDIFMMFIIVINIICLSVNTILLSNFGAWFFDLINMSHVLTYYQTHLHPWVVKTESWFITVLIAELGIRWFFAIIYKHHRRWFFFPFIHWYEILAIIPYLRFLRLIRAGIIAYRLHELGYKVVPQFIFNRVTFYYNLIMEELSDRVVVTVLDGVKKELDTSSSHKKIIHDLVNHHREMFATTLAQVLQESLATELKTQQQTISKGVGQVVIKAIEDTPELTQLLRLIPIVGGRIEQQIQSIGQRLGENITQGLIDPFIAGSPEQPNAQFVLIADKLSQLNIENNTLEQLVESVVYESLESVRKQVMIKQWQLELEKKDQLTE